MKLHIAANFTLPAEAVTQTFAILGIRGAGKTNTAVVITEELLKAHQQVVVIDPVDVWWGLKSSKGGKHPGFSLPVIGGDHADVPLDAAGGQVLADFVTDTRASVILALRHLSMNDQRRFAGDFAKRLYERKGQQRSPLMVMVDEADEFVPQRLPHGHEAMFGAFDRLVRRGRSSGIGVTLISQRAQVVNKDVLSQVETLIGMRVLHKLDRKALEAWIEAHDSEGRQEEFLASLASLGKGDAWIWSPSWLNVFTRVHIRERETYDSSATPKAGESVAPPKELAPVDLDQLRQSMAAQIEKAKADDPRELRRRIAELEKQAKIKAPTAPPAAAVSTKELSAAALANLKRQAEREISASLAPARRAMTKAIGSMQKAAAELQAAAEALRGAMPPESVEIHPAPAPTPRQPIPIAKRPEAHREPRAPATSTSGVSKAGRKILTALAQFGPSPDTKIAAVSGLVASAGHFGNKLAELRGAGLIEGQRSQLEITAAGIAALGNWEPLPTGDRLHQWWYSRLSRGPAQILKVLIEAYPHAQSDQQIAQALGLSAAAGHFGNCLSALRTRDLIVGPRSALRASDDLFAEENSAGGVA